jgi:peptidoglycan hydrolase-like protein with peptidoglycan-binding domain
VRTTRHLALALVAPLVAGTFITVVVASPATDESATGTTTPATAGTTAAPTSTTAVATTVTTAPPTTTTAPPPPDAFLRPGAHGPRVLALQQRLAALGFWLGTPDGTYGHATQQAVMAFQKWAGIGRDGIAGDATTAALEHATRPTPRSTADGAEIDLGRQLLLIVRGGRVLHAINTSTGRSGWATPAGSYRVQRAVDGVRHAPLGDLYRPRYFNGGIAIHGSWSIPGYPASHGCARVSNAAIDMLWASGLLALGSPVRVA